MLTVFVFLVFIILEAETLPKRLAAAYPSDIEENLKEILTDIGEGVYRYVILKTAVSFGAGVVTAIILIAMGIPGWLLWSMLTFLLSYVPYIGSLVALIPPALLGFLLLEPTSDILLVVFLIVKEQIWGQFIENNCLVPVSIFLQLCSLGHCILVLALGNLGDLAYMVIVKSSSAISQKHVRLRPPFRAGSSG